MKEPFIKFTPSTERAKDGEKIHAYHHDEYGQMPNERGDKVLKWWADYINKPHPFFPVWMGITTKKR